jgi:hypothetical protein
LFQTSGNGSGSSRTHPKFDVEALASAANLPATRVWAAMAQLGTAGRVGYARLNPRLVAARHLVLNGRLAVAAGWAWANSGDEWYRVRVDDGRAVSRACPMVGASPQRPWALQARACGMVLAPPRGEDALPADTKALT